MSSHIGPGYARTVCIIHWLHYIRKLVIGYSMPHQYNYSIIKHNNTVIRLLRRCHQALLKLLFKPRPWNRGFFRLKMASTLKSPQGLLIEVATAYAVRLTSTEFGLKCHWRLFLSVSDWQLVIISSDNSWVPNRRQTFIWVNFVLVFWRINMAVGWNEFMTSNFV